MSSPVSTAGWTDGDGAFEGIAAGARVVVGNACGTPLTLLDALAAHARRAGPIEITAGILIGDIDRVVDAVRSGALRLRLWHVFGPLRALSREGLVDYLPIRLFDLPETVLDHADVALIRVGPPDEDGRCALGPSTTFAETAAERVPLVIAEVDDGIPRTHGDSTIHVSRIHRLVRAETGMPEFASAPPGRNALGVARHVARIIPDGATLQLGIGAIGEAVAGVLQESAASRSLRMLGLVTDAMLPLVEAIVDAGNGPVPVLELIGTSALMSFAHDNPGIVMRSSRMLHNPVELARVPRLVSVNSAIAVDLHGQVVAESVDGDVIAAVGGSADFAEGAHLSDGGLRIVAMTSVTRRGASTVVAAHDSADTITAAHHSVDAVVTEHGVAWLRGRTRGQRAEALISIAAPEHRAALAASRGAIRSHGTEGRRG